MKKHGVDKNLTNELRRLGHYLLTIAEGENLYIVGSDIPALPLPDDGASRHNVDDTPKLVEIAVHEYRERARRNEHFGSDLFGEPGWDILLDLFVAKANGLRVSVTSACIAANVPLTTALRWLIVLEEKSLISRSEDVLDKRRTWVELTDQGYQLLADYLRDRGKHPRSRLISHKFATPNPIPRRS